MLEAHPLVFLALEPIMDDDEPTLDYFEMWITENYPRSSDSKWDNTGVAFYDRKNQFSAVEELLTEFRQHWSTLPTADDA